MEGDTRIAVDGVDADVESLWDWLRREPALRGRLRVGNAPAPDGAMGAAMEIVVAATAAAGVMTTLARSLSVWLVQRRSDLTIKITRPDGQQVSVSARRVADPEELLRAVLEPSPPPPDASQDG